MSILGTSVLCTEDVGDLVVTAAARTLGRPLHRAWQAVLAANN